jgi:hypothetical protein
LEELIEDSERRRRTRELAARIDEQWHQLSSEGEGGKLAIGSSDEAMKGNPLSRRELRVAFQEGPAGMLKNLPGKDPGAKFEPTAWTGSIKPRGEEDVKGGEQVDKEGDVAEKEVEGEWTAKVTQR